MHELMVKIPIVYIDGYQCCFFELIRWPEKLCMRTGLASLGESKRP